MAKHPVETKHTHPGKALSDETGLWRTECGTGLLWDPC